MKIIFDILTEYRKGGFTSYIATCDFIDYLFSFKEPIAVPFPIKITPEVAKYIVTKYNNNKYQRNLTKGTVDSYNKQMSEGKWRLNGETITFFANQSVGNGQHRMNASINSQTSFDAFIICGISEDTMPSIDTGKGRSAGDVMSMEHNEYGFKSTDLAGWIKTAFYVETGIPAEHGKTSTRKQAMSNDEVVQYYHENKELFEIFKENLKDWKKKQQTNQFMSVADIGGYCFYFYRKGYEVEIIRDFFDTLLGGKYGDKPLLVSLHTHLCKTKDKIIRYNFLTKAMEDYKNGNISKKLRNDNKSIRKIKN